MSAATALIQARAAGIQIGIDGGDLVLEAAAPPPREVLDLLERHKANLLALLRRRANWTAEDWQVDFDERAAIAEFEGGLPRPRAEALAFAGCVAEGLSQAGAAAVVTSMGSAPPLDFPEEFGTTAAPHGWRGGGTAERADARSHAVANTPAPAIALCCLVH